MKIKKKIFWIILCTFLTIICIRKVNSLFTIGQSLAYNTFDGFYKEKPGSLDALYIGSSNVHSFWQPPIAWASHGIAVRSWSINAMRSQSIIYMIEEARKTQPNALFIINLNCIKNTDVSDVFIHRATNYMKASVNKLKMIYSLSRTAGYEGTAQLEFFFPIIRFHTRWSKLNTLDYTGDQDYYKGGFTLHRFLRTTTDITQSYNTTNETEDLSTCQEQILSELLDYCEDNKLKVLFVTVPYVLSQSTIKQINQAAKIVKERGFAYIDLLNGINDTGINLTSDFRDRGHTNIHGSNKFTEYLSRYLIERYRFTDKRGTAGWESWDEAAEAYLELSGYYLIPIEQSHELRDFSMPVPANQTAVTEGQTITVTWDASEGAQSYEIFRRSTDPNEKNWKYHDTTKPGILEFIDSNLQPNMKYTYIIVPRYEADGKIYYGNFDYAGIAAKTDL